MAIDYDNVKNWVFPEIRQKYDIKDTMRYGLGVGFGLDPMDEGQLRFVYEQNLKAVPSMACVLGYPGPWARDPGLGLDYLKVVHGEQDLRLFRPVPVAGEIYSRTRITALIDKGADKGALVLLQRDLHDASDGGLIASQIQTTFARGDGGFGRSDPAPESLPSVPEGEPDQVCDLPTHPHQALLYRIGSDPNPLHADPQVARKAGFERPILHGLATFGVACHAVLRTCCGYETTDLKRLAVRFSAPVIPGETLRTEFWKRDGKVHFRTSVLERQKVVLSNGIAVLAR